MKFNGKSYVIDTATISAIVHHIYDTQNLEFIKFLIDRNCIKDNHVMTNILKNAIKYNRIDVIKYLFEKAIEDSASPNTRDLICDAFECNMYNYRELEDAIILQFTDDFIKPIMIKAIKNGNYKFIEIFSYFIDGYDELLDAFKQIVDTIDQEIINALFIKSIKIKNYKLINILIHRIENIDVIQSALITATQYDNTKLIEYFD